jgi:hypothetical protein
MKTATETATQNATLYFLGALAVVGVVACIFKLVADARRRRATRARWFAEARLFVEDIKAQQTLKTVATDAILKKGEKAFYNSRADLFETRAVRHYQAGTAGMKVAKGFYVGGTSGRSTSTQEWAQIDTGTLTITGKRLIFDGGSQDRTILLEKVVSVNPSRDGVEVSVEGRQKSMVFAVDNPLIAASVIRICCQVEDPMDLSNTNVDITFDE